MCIRDSYRRARCEVAGEVAPADEIAAQLRQPLVEAIGARLNQAIEVGDDVPIGILSDLLSQHIEMPVKTLAELFEEKDIRRRAERALLAHEDYPAGPSSPDNPAD